MKTPSLSLIVAISFSLIGGAAPLDSLVVKQGALAFSHDFETGLPKGFRAQFGDWRVVDGVLRARQIPADNHGAAARQVLEMGDGVFELRFRLVGEGTGFHFGFDPKRGSLKKKGHLFSVVVSPNQVKLMKHVDKAQPKEDPNEDLAKATHRFAPGGWHTLRLAKTGNEVVARITPDAGGEAITLKAGHPTFHVPTPTLVFRCIGDGAEVDDVKVWRARK